MISGEIQEESHIFLSGIDAATQDLWIDLLEINRQDPRLRPLRESLIGREWYWDEDIMYTLVETMEGMAIPVGEEATFIESHTDVILNRFIDPKHWRKEEHNKYRSGLELTHQRGELGSRLASVIGEVRRMLEKNGWRAEKVMPNELLFASLYTPTKERKQSAQMPFDSLREVPDSERPRIEKIIADSLEELRKRHTETDKE